MQKLITITLFLLLTLSSAAQTDWQWGKRGGSMSGGSFVKSEGEVEMVTDKNGNVYVLALISKGMTADVDGYVSPNPNNQMSLTKWSCDGTRKWTKYFGAPNAFTVPGCALGIDTLGGIYFTGMTTASGYFDTDTTLPTSITKIWYIVKYDTAGSFQWLRMPQADTVTFGYGSASKSGAVALLDVAPNGEVFILSRLAPGIFGGSYVSTSHSIHLLKFNKDGNLLNGKPVAITLDYEPADGSIKTRNLMDPRTGFARDRNSGRFYISGMFSSDDESLTFGTTSLEDLPTLGSPMYIAAFDSSGNNLWVEQSSSNGAGGGMMSRPGIDELGNIYLSGGATLGSSFLGHTFTNSYSSLRGALYVLSINKTGSLNWAKNARFESASALPGLSYANNIVSVSDFWMRFFSWGADSVTGSLTDGYNHLSRFNAHTGVPIKRIDTFRVVGTGYRTTDITTDNNGNVYIGGHLSHKIFLPFVTLTSIGGIFDFFVVKYGSADCDCSLATPDFSSSSSAGSTTVSFTYTGSSGVDSVRWEFGDGAMASGLSTSHTYASAGTYGVSIVVYNACGIIVYYKEVTTGTTGIEDATSLSAVSIYPNPTTESVVIEGAGMGTSVTLYNTIGQQVLSTTITQEKQSVNLSGISDGLYIIHFTTKEGRKGSVKMMKQ